MLVPFKNRKKGHAVIFGKAPEWSDRYEKKAPWSTILRAFHEMDETEFPWNIIYIYSSLEISIHRTEFCGQRLRNPFTIFLLFCEKALKKNYLVKVERKKTGGLSRNVTRIPLDTLSWNKNAPCIKKNSIADYGEEHTRKCLIFWKPKGWGGYEKKSIEGWPIKSSSSCLLWQLLLTSGAVGVY